MMLDRTRNNTSIFSVSQLELTHNQKCAFLGYCSIKLQDAIETHGYEEIFQIDIANKDIESSPQIHLLFLHHQKYHAHLKDEEFIESRIDKVIILLRKLNDKKILDTTELIYSSEQSEQFCGRAKVNFSLWKEFFYEKHNLFLSFTQLSDENTIIEYACNSLNSYFSTVAICNYEKNRKAFVISEEKGENFQIYKKGMLSKLLKNFDIDEEEITIEEPRDDFDYDYDYCIPLTIIQNAIDNPLLKMKLYGRIFASFYEDAIDSYTNEIVDGSKLNSASINNNINNNAQQYTIEEQAVDQNSGILLYAYNSQILKLIFRYMTPTQLVRLESVSKEFRRVAQGILKDSSYKKEYAHRFGFFEKDNNMITLAKIPQSIGRAYLFYITKILQELLLEHKDFYLRFSENDNMPVIGVEYENNNNNEEKAI